VSNTDLKNITRVDHASCMLEGYLVRVQWKSKRRQAWIPDNRYQDPLAQPPREGARQAAHREAHPVVGPAAVDEEELEAREEAMSDRIHLSKVMLSGMGQPRGTYMAGMKTA
jgi:hypothetical protein